MNDGFWKVIESESTVSQFENFAIRQFDSSIR